MSINSTPLEWHKIGRVFGPAEGAQWMKSHAQVPTPLVIEKEGVLRVYFSSRPDRGMSLTSYVDLDLADFTKIVKVNQQPLLELGRPGTFDEHGIMPSCAVRTGDLVYLYYSGWSRATSVPYTNSTGLAISEDGGKTFRRAGEGPVLAKSLHDPWSATSPFVMKTGDQWRMWYCAGTGWVQVDGKYEHVYDIKEAVSSDGITWTPLCRSSIPATEGEEALTRPWIMPFGDSWRLWYCHRRSKDFRDGSGAYRISSASSPDLDSWTRIGRDGPVGAWENTWDSATQAYPALFEFNQKLHMLYNGNDFGADGFGICTAQLAS